MSALVTVCVSHRSSRPHWYWCVPVGWTPADPGLADDDLLPKERAACNALDEGVIWAADEGTIAGLAVYAVGNYSEGDELDVALSDLRWLQTDSSDLAVLADVAIGGAS